MTDFADIFTFTRASKAWGLDAAGALVEFAIDQPAFVVEGGVAGLRLEGSSINRLTNPRGEGAVAGSPGTAPTTWVFQNAPAGITRTVVAAGTSNGFPYLDVRYNGTATASGSLRIDFGPATGIAAAPAEVWSASLFLALVAGSTANLGSDQLALVFRDGAGASVGAVGATVTPGANARYAVTGTAPAGTANAQTYWSAAVANGAVVDITVRVAAPQLEIQPFATSPILPPAGTLAASTRAADVCAFSPAPLAAAPMLLRLKYRFSAVGAVATQHVLHMGANSANDRIGVFRDAATARLNLFGYVGGAVQGFSDVGPAAAATEYSLAARLATNDLAVSVNGAAAVTDAVWALPTLLEGRLGAGFGGGQPMFGIIRLFELRPNYSRTNAELQALSA